MICVLTEKASVNLLEYKYCVLKFQSHVLRTKQDWCGRQDFGLHDVLPPEVMPINIILLLAKKEF